MPIHLPSPALCVATLALVVSAGGTTYAAVQIGTKDIKNQAVTSPKIADSTIRTKDISLAARTALKGKRGPVGPHGATGPSGPSGPQGPAGAAGSARAYADITDQQKVVNSKGVLYVDRVATGLYCVNLVSSIATSSVSPVVSVDWGNSGGSNLIAYWSTVGTVPCTAAADFVVRTYTTGNGPNTLSNAVGFSFLVP